MDCGGPVAPPCADGKQCLVDSDCENGQCGPAVPGVCQVRVLASPASLSMVCHQVHLQRQQSGLTFRMPGWVLPLQRPLSALPTSPTPYGA